MSQNNINIIIKSRLPNVDKIMNEVTACNEGEQNERTKKKIQKITSLIALVVTAHRRT